MYGYYCTVENVEPVEGGVIVTVGTGGHSGMAYHGPTTVPEHGRRFFFPAEIAGRASEFVERGLCRERAMAEGGPGHALGIREIE